MIRVAITLDSPDCPFDDHFGWSHGCTVIREMDDLNATGHMSSFGPMSHYVRWVGVSQKVGVTGM